MLLVETEKEEAKKTKGEESMSLHEASALREASTLKRTESSAESGVAVVVQTDLKELHRDHTWCTPTHRAPSTRCTA